MTKVERYLIVQARAELTIVPASARLARRSLLAS